MKFGILYNVEYHPEIHGSPSQYYEHILDQIQLEEELGYDAVWFGEHHYSGYSFGSPPLMAMAAAARTKRIRLGTGVSLVPLHHPIRLAEEYAMLDVLSQGRLEYGIGRGFIKYAYEVFGVDEDENVRRYREGTDLLVKAWLADAPFSYQGEFYTLQDYSFFPKPRQQPHPPMYAAGAVTPESYEWAGSRGCSPLLLAVPRIAARLEAPASEDRQRRVFRVALIARRSSAEHEYGAPPVPGRSAEGAVRAEPRRLPHGRMPRNAAWRSPSPRRCEK